jgi:hypothetical protein
VFTPVGVLPQTDAEDWNALDLRHTHHEVVVLVVGCGYYQVAVWGTTQPGEARQVPLLHLGGEGLLEAVKAREVLVNGLEKLQQHKKDQT